VSAREQRASKKTILLLIEMSENANLKSQHLHRPRILQKAKLCMDRRDKLPHPRRGWWIRPLSRTVHPLPQVPMSSNMSPVTSAPQFEPHYKPEPRSQTRPLGYTPSYCSPARHAARPWPAITGRCQSARRPSRLWPAPGYSRAPGSAEPEPMEKRSRNPPERSRNRARRCPRGSRT
jgi:hypothetical protein